MTDRLALLIPDAVEKISNLHILVIGLGGVGGYALESIARLDVKKITIVDADKIDVSNINRQIIATTKTIGQYKTDAFEKRLKEINPDIEVIKITKFISSDNLMELFKEQIDYVVDCCDTIATKEALISYCTSNNIKLISSMGTGNKLHPERFKIMKLKDTSYDPLAKVLRKYVKDNAIKKDVYVVCSDEEKVVKATDVIPSCSFVPPVAGLLCTSYIVNDIVKQVDQNAK